MPMLTLVSKLQSMTLEDVEEYVMPTEFYEVRSETSPKASRRLMWMCATLTYGLALGWLGFISEQELTNSEKMEEIMNSDRTGQGPTKRSWATFMTQHKDTEYKCEMLVNVDAAFDFTANQTAHLPDADRGTWHYFLARVQESYTQCRVDMETAAPCEWRDGRHYKVDITDLVQYRHEMDAKGAVTVLDGDVYAYDSEIGRLSKYSPTRGSVETVFEAQGLVPNSMAYYSVAAVGDRMYLTCGNSEVESKQPGTTTPGSRRLQQPDLNSISGLANEPVVEEWSCGLYAWDGDTLTQVIEDHRLEAATDLDADRTTGDLYVVVADGLVYKTLHDGGNATLERVFSEVKNPTKISIAPPYAWILSSSETLQIEASSPPDFITTEGGDEDEEDESAGDQAEVRVYRCALATGGDCEVAATLAGQEEAGVGIDLAATKHGRIFVAIGLPATTIYEYNATTNGTLVEYLLPTSLHTSNALSGIAADPDTEVFTYVEDGDDVGFFLVDVPYKTVRYAQTADATVTWFMCADALHPAHLVPTTMSEAVKEARSCRAGRAWQGRYFSLLFTSQDEVAAYVHKQAPADCVALEVTDEICRSIADQPPYLCKWERYPRGTDVLANIFANAELAFIICLIAASLLLGYLTHAFPSERYSVYETKRLQRASSTKGHKVAVKDAPDFDDDDDTTVLRRKVALLEARLAKLETFLPVADGCGGANNNDNSVAASPAPAATKTTKKKKWVSRAKHASAMPPLAHTQPTPASESTCDGGVSSCIWSPSTSSSAAAEQQHLQQGSSSQSSSPQKQRKKRGASPDAPKRSPSPTETYVLELLDEKPASL